METVLVVTALLAGLLLAAWSFQRRIMYFPDSIPRDEPISDVGPSDREVWMTAADGEEIHGLYRPPDSGRLCVLLLHGNAQSLQAWKYLHLEVGELGCGLLTIDYRGYGKSTGTPTEKGLYADGRAALSFLAGQGVDPSQVVLFGKSLGTGVAVQLACETQVAGAWLESPYLSFASVGRRILPFLPGGEALLMDNYDSLSKIGGLRCPLLVTLGDADTLILPGESRQLFESAPEPKTLYEVAGAGHNDIQMVGGQLYWKAVGSWLDGLKT